jgi:hypothetical protein
VDAVLLRSRALLGAAADTGTLGQLAVHLGGGEPRGAVHGGGAVAVRMIGSINTRLLQSERRRGAASTQHTTNVIHKALKQVVANLDSQGLKLTHVGWNYTAPELFRVTEKSGFPYAEKAAETFQL